MKYSNSKTLKFLLFWVTVLALICIVSQWIQVSSAGTSPMTISSSDAEAFADAGITVDISGEKGEKDSWVAQVVVPNNPGRTEEYIGATCSILIENDTHYDITDWTLRFDVQNKCLLNGFWCGDYEVHQFRDGQEIVDTFNSNDDDLNSLTLEHFYTGIQLMITLEPGDYLVYHPSEEADENLIEAGKSVGIGTIYYFRKAMDLSVYELSYYKEMKFTDGVLFWVIIGLLALIVIILVIHGVSELTVRRALREVETVNNAVINGLCREYKTLWLINVKNRTIQLIRNENAQDVQEAVDIATDMDDYDVAVRFYVDHFVRKEYREKLWEQVALDSVIEHIEREPFFAVPYLHYSEEEGERYFQMAFAKASCRGEENIVLAYRDIDKYERERLNYQKQLEEALEKAEDANRSKSIFLANMSHEIRTPINAILGMDTMILRESKEDEVKGYAKDIRSASNTLLALINDILDFSKIESGRMEIIQGRYRLDSVVNDLVNMVRNKAEEKGLELKLKIDPETPVKLYGDETRVKQIILNILNNAVKYTKQGSVLLKVGYTFKNDDACRLEVSVTDTGVGIKPEDMDKLFSPYARLDEEKHKGVEGTGLGLSITQKLLEKMNTKLEVSSVYGEGSTFSFELDQPLWGPEPIGDHLVVVHETGEKPERFHAKDAHILVVDDVEMNLIVIKNLLKRICVEPELSLDGAEAVEMAKTKKYDMIFLDAMMPGMSGEDTLAAMRKECDINKDTPIFVLTANAIIGAREEYISIGFTDYLSKPVDGMLLENMIEKYLPEEKKLPVDASDSEGGQDSEASLKQKAEAEALERLRAAIEEIPQINTASGIAAAGGLPTYINICENFANTAESRRQQISDFFEAGDIPNYTIQVHALKSSARLIGANGLSEKALLLEMAGKENDENTIKNDTESLLMDYNEIGSCLETIFSATQQASSADSQKEELPEKKLRRKLSELQELIEAFDFESAKELFSDLQEYRLPEDFAEINRRLKAQMADVDHEGILESIATYMREKR